MQLLILSDIHGNLAALSSVLADAFERFEPDGIALLGDVIDYGMRSNEVIEVLQTLPVPLVCALWGNHEDAVLNSNYVKFSSERGIASAKRTAEHLSDEARAWLTRLDGKEGRAVFKWDAKNVLAIHGNKEDPLWGTLAPIQESYDEYGFYDVVLSGHSHIPHAFTIGSHVDDPSRRNKKMITFINPGSVGQPRDHDPRASYGLWDTERGISLCRVPYDIEVEQALFDDSVDRFYRDRLILGL